MEDPLVERPSTAAHPMTGCPDFGHATFWQFSTNVVSVDFRLPSPKTNNKHMSKVIL